MNNISDMNNNNITLNVFSALSFYSPLILMMSILLFSIFSSAVFKGLFYIFCLFWTSVLRGLFIKYVFGVEDELVPNNICNSGVFLPTTNYTFSTFILVLSLTYFVMPMIVIGKQNDTNTVNYMVLMFFLTYICYDIGIKKLYGCIDFTSQLIGDIFSALALGAIIVMTLISTGNTSLLFINELTSNKEVCSRPSKQQFKCSLYKNGEIVGSSVSK
jgi:hypothetical protein